MLACRVSSIGICRSLSESPTKLSREKAQVTGQTHTVPLQHPSSTATGPPGRDAELGPLSGKKHLPYVVGYGLSQLIYIKHLAIWLAHSAQ